MNFSYFDQLTVSKLAASFGNTSATYKFYWLLPILELVEDGQGNHIKSHLFARMIGNAWYAVIFFYVFFWELGSDTTSTLYRSMKCLRGTLCKISL